MKAINVNTLEEREFTVEGEHLPPSKRVYVADDGERWEATAFLLNWRTEGGRDYWQLVARKIRESHK
jgi:hypothetical protein